MTDATFETFDDTPSRAAVLLVLAPAAVAVAASAAAPLGLVAGATGTVVLVGGVRLGSRRIATVGTVALFCGVLLAGVRGGSILQVTAGAGAAIVAWDAGINAIGVARQLGARARTRRLLLAHTAATTLVAVGVGVATLVVFVATGSGEPAAAIAVLAVAALLITVLLDR